MSRLQDTIDEGENKKVTIETSVDPSGETCYLYAFLRNDPSTKFTLGTADGDNATESNGTYTIEFVNCNIVQLTAGRFYLLEAYINPDDDNSRKLLHPEDGQHHFVRIFDRNQT